MDKKEYKISRLAFNDAFKLADKLNLINLVPIVALSNKVQREALLDVLEIVLQYNHPELTRERLIKEKIFDIGHIKQILNITLDINELKK